MLRAVAFRLTILIQSGAIVYQAERTIRKHKQTCYAPVDARLYSALLHMRNAATALLYAVKRFSSQAEIHDMLKVLMLYTLECTWYYSFIG